MEIILLGYMGSGKSTIAKQLAHRLHLEMIDLDDYKADKENLSVLEIFNTKGEIYFRKLENETLKEVVATKENYVLALGGGTPCYANNMEIIKEKVFSYYLKASIQTLNDRLLLEKSDRPLIKFLKEDQLVEFIAKHLFERAPYYEQASHTIQIDSKNIDEIVAKIIADTQ